MIRIIRVMLGLCAAMLVVLQVVVEPLIVASEAMRPTLVVGDRALLFKLSYGVHVGGKRFWRWAEPAPGHIITFRSPRDRETLLTRRVLAVSGDEVEVRGEAVIVNGKPLEHKLLDHSADCVEVKLNWLLGGSPNRIRDDCELWSERNRGLSYQVLLSVVSKSGNRTWRVPERTLFTMADNRGNSADDEATASVPVDDVIGRIAIVGWSRRETPASGESSSSRWGRLLTIVSQP